MGPEFGGMGGFGGPPVWWVFAAGLVTVAVVLIFGTVIFRGVSVWAKNNASPVKTVFARVVAKRGHVSGGGGETSASTWYYVTFEREQDGERVELQVPARLYGLLVESDRGTLTYQGTRFQGFERQI